MHADFPRQVGVDAAAQPGEHHVEGGGGPDYGSAVVDTHTRRGYGQACANVGTLLRNLEFSLAMESQIMGAILDDQE
ncbi:hypothetical protein D3C85_1221040 [compost metagenome]